MKKHAFVMIRYSVLTKNNNAWIIGRDNDFKKYKEELFSNKRMSFHEDLFHKVTLPSLKKMNENNVTILLFTSEDLPEENMKNLQDLKGELNNIKIFPLPDDVKIIEEMESSLLSVLEDFDSSVCYATIRLDDDDALADNFEEEIYKYIDPMFKGHAISFSNGYEGIYEDGAYSCFVGKKVPKIAMGLSFIQVYNKEVKPSIVSVYGLGNHTKIDEEYPTIINPKTPMFIRTVHPESDIYSKKFDEKINRYKGDPSISYDKLINSFASLRGDSNIINLFPSVKYMKDENYQDFCITHHDTFLFYSYKDLSFFHKSLNGSLNENCEAVIVDPENGCLKLENSGRFIIYSSGEFMATDDLKIKFGYKLNKVGRGFSVSVDKDNKFLSAVHDGCVSLKPHCRDWEYFYRN